MQWLLDLFNSLPIVGAAGGSPSEQVMKPGSDGGALPGANPAPSPMQQHAMQAGDASTSAGGRQGAGAMSEGMAKILAATLLANPTGQTFPGAVAPPRSQPFQYQPPAMAKAAPLDPRRGLSRV